MKFHVLFSAMILSFKMWSGVSYENSDKNVKQTDMDKTVKTVEKSMSVGDISTVNGRLRVEGAAFRRFNLYFPSSKTINGKSADLAATVHQIIERDLALVGTFSFIRHEDKAKNDSDDLMKQKGAEGISRIIFSVVNDRVKMAVHHKNLITGNEVVRHFDDALSNKRALAHRISQSIYENFIGPENLFELKIAAVKRDSSGQNQIVLLDFDGNNESFITDNRWVKSCPYFTPDGKGILYTVSSTQGQGIVEQEIGSKQYQFRVKKPGLNIDPRVFPDNSAMLATLSFENNTNIYRLSRLGTIIGKVTHGLSLDLSPAIRPDGLELAFVSDRSGTPQIYVQPLNTANSPPTRLTFQGRYNQTPHYSPDGKQIAFTGRDEKKVFDIFLVERATGRVSRVTQNQGRNQEPYFTPSGRFIIFTSEREGKPKPDIFIASLNGDHQYRLTNANSDHKTQGYFSPVVQPKPQARFLPSLIRTKL